MSTHKASNPAATGTKHRETTPKSGFRINHTCNRNMLNEKTQPRQPRLKSAVTLGQNDLSMEATATPLRTPSSKHYNYTVFIDKMTLKGNPGKNQQQLRDYQRFDGQASKPRIHLPLRREKKHAQG
jgi:hypothetical protein